MKLISVALDIFNNPSCLNDKEKAAIKIRDFFSETLNDWKKIPDTYLTTLSEMKNAKEGPATSQDDERDLKMSYLIADLSDNDPFHAYMATVASASDHEIGIEFENEREREHAAFLEMKRFQRLVNDSKFRQQYLKAVMRNNGYVKKFERLTIIEKIIGDRYIELYQRDTTPIEVHMARHRSVGGSSSASSSITVSPRRITSPHVPLLDDNDNLGPVRHIPSIITLESSEGFDEITDEMLR